MDPALEAREAQRLVDTYADLILRLSYTYLNHTQDAQDICQTVFLKLLEKVPAFQSPEHERAWIIRTTANACQGFAEKPLAEKPPPPWRRAAAVPAPQPEEGSLLAAVNQLPPQYRAVIYLHYYEGYSAQEIARMLRKTPSAVASLLHRGRRRLKTLLESEGLA